MPSRFLLAVAFATTICTFVPTTAMGDIVHFTLAPGTSTFRPLGPDGPGLGYYPGWIMEPPNMLAHHGAELCGAWSISGEFGFDGVSSLQPGVVIDAGLPARLDPVRGAWINAGIPPAGPAVVGLRLSIDGAWHYGWTRFTFENFLFQYTDFAYETQADMPIAAGAIPSPGPVALLIVSGVAIARRRR